MDAALRTNDASAAANGHRAVVELAAPAAARCRVTNETPHRIVIACTHGKAEALYLVGFGSLEMTAAQLDRFDHAPWTARGLVTVVPVAEVARPNHAATVAGVTAIGTVLSVLGVALAATLGWLPPLTPWWAVPGGLAVVALGALAYPHVPVLRIMEPALRSVTLVLSLAIAVGLPATIALGRGPDFLRSVALPGLLQWATISVACVTPAAFYFLFQRQRLDLVRETFLRQVLFLDPSVATKREARAKYQMLLDEVYGTTTRTLPLADRGTTDSPQHGLAMPVIVTTLLITAGWLLVTLPPPPAGSPLPDTVRQALVFGFFGAYYFAVNMTFRRYLRADLNPKAYSQIIVRLLTTALLTVVLSAIMVPGATAVPAAGTAALGTLYATAFFAGFVPETAMAVIRQRLQMQVLRSTRDRHGVTELDGINLYDRSRLLEEGIESVENLAHASPIELMLRTRIPTARLVDLFDQAILYLHLATGEDPPHEDWKKLRSCGIRTATDLVMAHRRLRSPEERKAFSALLATAGDVSRLDSILRVLQDDEWMVHLLHWRRTFGRARTLCRPDQLVAT